jgi:hypothetical protein
MWADTGDRYFTITADSADVNSGTHSSSSGNSSSNSSSSCKGVLKAAVDQTGQLIKSQEGRQEVAAAFNLCQPLQLTSLAAGQQFLWEVVEGFAWYAMSNNQPSNIGLMQEYCTVLLDASSAGADPMNALARMTRYIEHDGSDSWCYDSNYSEEDNPQQIPEQPVMVDIDAAYSYQCCTQGAVHGGILPSAGTAASFMPAKNASLQAFLQDCRQQFGADLPALQPPWFMRDVARLGLEVGGLVFTGGSLDPWQGGSWASMEDVQATRASNGGRLITRRSHSSSRDASSPTNDASLNGGTGYVEDSASLSGAMSLAQQLSTGFAGRTAAAVAVGPTTVVPDRIRDLRLAFVVYENASHCTDTHTYTWNQPGEPPAWRKQRAQAMDYAAQFAEQHRLRVRRSRPG